MNSDRPDRTSEIALRDWVRDPHFHGWDPEETSLVDSGLLHNGSPKKLRVEDLCASGLSLADLEARRTLHHPQTDATMSAGMTFARLTELLGVAPDLALRDAFGYCLVAPQTHGGNDGHVALYRLWDEVGHGSDGWRLTAAGLSPAEVAEHGAPDATSVDTLIALRGLTLPH